MPKNIKESLPNTAESSKEYQKVSKEIPLSEINEQFKNLFSGKIKREIVSGGAMGNINKIEDEKGFKICEKEYLPALRYLQIPVQEYQESLQKNLEAGNRAFPLSEYKKKIKKNEIVFDLLKNEIKAFERTKGIPGIPRLYGSITTKQNNALYLEFIEGTDLLGPLSAETSQENEIINELTKSKDNLDKIFSQIKNTIKQAAERGVIWNGGSIILDKDLTPYLVEWYLSSLGSIDEEAFKKLYENTMANINNLHDQLAMDIIKEELKAA
jgi:serine/threonine protein kinase